MQSVMLGAIPGKNPKLTMIAVLSYSESTDDIYPDALESLGSKFSILKPDQNMIQKILYVAEQPSPVPSAAVAAAWQKTSIHLLLKKQNLLSGLKVTKNACRMSPAKVSGQVYRHCSISTLISDLSAAVK